jgi:hypothetical protein
MGAIRHGLQVLTFTQPRHLAKDNFTKRDADLKSLLSSNVQL